MKNNTVTNYITFICQQDNGIRTFLENTADLKKQVFEQCETFTV